MSKLLVFFFSSLCIDFFTFAFVSCKHIDIVASRIKVMCSFVFISFVYNFYPLLMSFIFPTPYSLFATFNILAVGVVSCTFGLHWLLFCVASCIPFHSSLLCFFPDTIDLSYSSSFVFAQHVSNTVFVRLSLDIQHTWPKPPKIFFYVFLCVWGVPFVVSVRTFCFFFLYLGFCFQFFSSISY